MSLTSNVRLGPAPQRVLLMDEISTGLDSATTYTVTDYLRTTTHYLHLTTLVSLLQPPPEVLLASSSAAPLHCCAHVAAAGRSQRKSHLACGVACDHLLMSVTFGASSCCKHAADQGGIPRFLHEACYSCVLLLFVACGSQSSYNNGFRVGWCRCTTSLMTSSS